MKLLCFFLLLSYPLISQANELSSPVFLSQGGAGGASLSEDVSYLINPAAMGFQRMNKGALFYSFNPKRQMAFLSLSDVKTQFPVAITYQRFWSDSFRKSAKDKISISSGFSILPYASLGFSIEDFKSFSNWNGSLGSVVRLGNQFSLAVFLDQILKKENKNQRVLTLAFYYNWKQFFSTRLDISKTAHQGWIFRGGLESFFQSFLSIRLGGVWLNNTQKGLISGGLAFQSPKLSLEYSIQQNDKIYQQALSLILHI